MATNTKTIKKSTVRQSAARGLSPALKLAAQVEHLLSPLEDSIATLSLPLLHAVHKKLTHLGIGNEAHISCPHHARFCEIIHRRSRYLASTQRAIDDIETSLSEIRALSELLPEKERPKLLPEQESLKSALALLQKTQEGGDSTGIEHLFERLRKIVE